MAVLFRCRGNRLPFPTGRAPTISQAVGHPATQALRLHRGCTESRPPRSPKMGPHLKVTSGRSIFRPNMKIIIGEVEPVPTIGPIPMTRIWEGLRWTTRFGGIGKRKPSTR